MKICLINNLYKPYNKGGAEQVVELAASKLIKEGDEVSIITTKPKFQLSIINTQCSIKKYYLSSFYYNLNKIPLFLRLFWHLWDMFDFVNYCKVKKILKKEKPDLVITHNLKGISFLIPRLIKKLNIKHTHTLHDIQLLHPSGLMLYGKENKINSLFAKMYAQICKYLFASPGIIVSPSQWLMNIHIDKGFFKSSNLRVKQNLSYDKIHRHVNESNNFLYVGQIEEHKGILFLINVFKKIDYKLTIVGDGSKSEEIQNITKNNKNIIILGKKNKNEVKEIMQKADCLIVPSICYENAPTVIFEAQNIGLPIIASNIGGIPELINKKFLFEPKNTQELMQIIKKLSTLKTL